MSEHHDNIATLINQMGYWGGSEIEPALGKAVDAWHDSLNKHQSGDAKGAHRQLQLVAEHLKTAENLYSGQDKNFGFSMRPSQLAEGELNPYKSAYVTQ